MVGFPRQEDIDSFVAITSENEHTARLALDREPNLETAINKYFEGTLFENNVATISTWDESEMHAGKEYGPQTRPQNSFHIESENDPQTLGPGVFASTLSRPSSPADKEDTNLQKGILASVAHSTYPQTQSFGPANQASYNPQQWALTTTKTQSVLEDPEPRLRARMPACPAFIKPASEDHRLPGLLTIYSQIPLAREALLAREHIQPEYGQSEDWWQGQPTQSGKVVTTTDDGHMEIEETPVMDEVQRIMAFLEITERAYGSAEPLIRAIDASRHRPWTNEHVDDAYLLTTWRDEYKEVVEDGSLRNVFTMSAYERTEGEITEQSHFQIFKLHLQYPVVIESLYDLIDEVLWGNWVKDSPSEPYLDFSDIITFEMGNSVRLISSNSDSIDWPLVWYADRYLEEHVGKAVTMLYGQGEIEEERNDIQKQQDTLEFVGLAATAKRTAAVDLLKVVKPFLNGTRKDADELDRRDEEIVGGAKYHPLEEYPEIGKQLQIVAEEIQKQHDTLERAKSQLNIKKKQITEYLKEPTKDAPLKARYSLRGFCLDAYTTFLLVNPSTPEDLLDTDIHNWPWWRIYWDSQSEEPVDIRQVDAIDVSEAARKAESLTAVYASDKALRYPTKPLPDSLKNFVRHDNLYFDEELKNPGFHRNIRVSHDPWAHIQGNAYQDNVRSPNSSVNSMAANLDTDMQDMEPLIEDDLDPPSYSTTPPPPIPPRIGEKRRAGTMSPIENLMDADPQESGVVDLLDDDAPYDIHMDDTESYYKVPGGSSSGVSNAVPHQASYPKEIQMSDIHETLAKEPSPKRVTLSPSRKEKEQTSLI